MDLGRRRERLRLRTGEVAARFDEDRAKLEGRGDQPARAGETFVFKETCAFPVEWLFLERDMSAQRRALVVPMDDFPLAGSRDLADSTGEDSGVRHIRCGLGTWIDEKALRPDLRTGTLESGVLEQARRKSAEIEAGSLQASTSEEEVEADPEYVSWMKSLGEAQASLPGNPQAAEGAQGPGGQPAVLAFERPASGRRWWRQARAGYALAAAFAAAAVGLSFWIGRLRTELLRPIMIGTSSAQEIVFGDVDRSPEGLTLTATATHVVVYLVWSEIEDHPAYRVRLVEVGTDEIVWESAMAARDSEQLLAVPRRLMKTEDYRIQLLSIDESRNERLLDEREVQIKSH